MGGEQLPIFAMNPRAPIFFEVFLGVPFELVPIKIVGIVTFPVAFRYVQHKLCYQLCDQNRIWSQIIEERGWWTLLPEHFRELGL